VKRITTALGLPSLSEVGVREADLPRLAKVAADNISAPSNPRPITEQDFLWLFRKIL
jgi:alcohol dehydrogenase class IV